jgi:hypothetical protein
MGFIGKDCAAASRGKVLLKITPIVDYRLQTNKLIYRSEGPWPYRKGPTGENVPLYNFLRISNKPRERKAVP